MDIIESGKIVIEKEIQSLNNLKDNLGSSFARACQLIAATKGRVVFLGLGKSGHVAKKCAATFSSLGTPSFFIHAAEAFHGDLGVIAANDSLIALSFSGKTAEVLKAVDYCRQKNVVVIGISGDDASLLSQKSTVHINIGVEQEADHLQVAPTASTTAMIALGDALASVVSEQKGFTQDNFHVFHPDGSLGQLLDNE